MEKEKIYLYKFDFTYLAITVKEFNIENTNGNVFRVRDNRNIISTKFIKPEKLNTSLFFMWSYNNNNDEKKYFLHELLLNEIEQKQKIEREYFNRCDRVEKLMHEFNKQKGKLKK